MVRLEPSEEAALQPCPWVETHLGVLDHRHRVLMLLPLPWEHGCLQSFGDRAGTRGHAMELQCVGGEADSVTQRTDHRPRVTPAHRQVLADGEHGAAACM